LHTQAALIALSENDRNGLVQAAIDHAWQQNQSVHNASTQCFEKKRMQQLLDQWLELESKRPPFRVVDTEKAFLLHLPENTVQPPRLELYITADRIDQDSANHTILIDYKTGKKQSPSKWMGERMEEPQLPLYAAAAKLGKHDAVTFATVRSGHEMGFEGLAGEDIGIDGIAVCDGKRERPGDWQQQLDDWKNALNSIAQEFVEGRSDVDPRDSKACRYCGLEAICRIEETGFDSNNEDDS
ncbi:MAG: PD-(D/E)XK nuclease family protein, partial [Mariprofundus sp.]